MSRRTPEQKNNILELKKELISLIEANKITSYEVSNGITNISSTTVQNIINGTSKYPNEGKMKAVIGYIKKNYKKDDLQENVKKSEITKYGRKNFADNLKEIKESVEFQEKTLQKIIDMIEENSIRQKLIIEFLTNAKEIEVKFLKDKIKTF